MIFQYTFNNKCVSIPKHKNTIKYHDVYAIYINTYIHMYVCKNINITQTCGRSIELKLKFFSVKS